MSSSVKAVRAIRPKQPKVVYGKSHVAKRRQRVLPTPVVGKYPQLVIRADGSSFTHWISSPRSTIHLTRDVTNNPAWNTGLWSASSGIEEEGAVTGRMGRFSRRFSEMGLAAEETFTKAAE